MCLFCRINKIVRKVMGGIGNNMGKIRKLKMIKFDIMKNSEPTGFGPVGSW